LLKGGAVAPQVKEKVNSSGIVYGPQGLRYFDRLFWVLAKRLWPKWKQALVIVTPEIVVRWHRAGFRTYWNWLSRHWSAMGRSEFQKKYVS
jgi:hypothetical protein